MKNLLRIVAACLAVALPGAGFAATVAPAVTLDRPPSIGGVNGTGFAVGYRFLVNATVNVTALGAYDFGGDGIVGGADVGLYALDGTLLASATVAAGTGGTLVGAFRYAEIDGVQLLAGVEYVLGSYSTDPQGFFNANYGGVTLSTDDAITLLRNRDLPGVAGLVFPSREPSNSHLGSFGPNMLIAAVPLPAALPLMLCGLILLGAVTRRRVTA